LMHHRSHEQKEDSQDVEKVEKTVCRKTGGHSQKDDPRKIPRGIFFHPHPRSAQELYCKQDQRRDEYREQESRKISVNTERKQESEQNAHLQEPHLIFFHFPDIYLIHPHHPPHIPGYLPADIPELCIWRPAL